MTEREQILLEILRNLILRYGSDDVRAWRNAREIVAEIDRECAGWDESDDSAYNSPTHVPYSNLRKSQ